jgi:DNA-binding transcriptional LysR family regulator
VIQVLAGELRPDDTVLWSEDLAWMTSAECPYEDGSIPLVTYGEHCNYRAVSEPLLDRAGIGHWVAFSGQTTAGVRQAVEVGLGVALLGRSLLGPDLVEWRPGTDLGELPMMYQVARIDSSDVSPLTSAVVDAIRDEIAEQVPLPT